MKSLVKLVATLWLVTPAALAADALPKPLSDLECLVGTWKGTGSFSAGKDKAALAATWSCQRTSARYGVLCTLRVSGVPGLAVYEETDLFGFEPNTNLYHWYSVTNAGETHDHVAKVPAGNDVEFVFDGTQEGKPFREVIGMAFGKDQKSIGARAETFVAGKSTSVFALNLRK